MPIGVSTSVRVIVPLHFISGKTIDRKYDLQRRLNSAINNNSSIYRFNIVEDFVELTLIDNYL